VHPRERKDPRIQELTHFNEIKTDRQKLKKSRHRKQKKRLSRQEYKDLGLFSLPRKTLKYEDYTQLNELWSSYMDQQFGAGDQHSLQAKFDPTHSQYDQTSALLHKSDFHGAKVKVSHSKCASMVGHKGIILMDTKGTFSIISKDNVLRVIPKSDSIFVLRWRSARFSLFGKHLCHRSADRSTKKMKSIALCEL
jgi:ribonuclease P protein subunit POP4